MKGVYLFIFNVNIFDISAFWCTLFFHIDILIFIDKYISFLLLNLVLCLERTPRFPACLLSLSCFIILGPQVIHFLCRVKK